MLRVQQSQVVFISQGRDEAVPAFLHNYQHFTSLEPTYLDIEIITAELGCYSDIWIQLAFDPALFAFSFFNEKHTQKLIRVLQCLSFHINSMFGLDVFHKTRTVE